jgi:hypothetical protein
MNTHDDEPAFPIPGGGCLATVLSLRDYFAAAALQGILAADVHDGAFEYFDGKTPHSEWVPVTAYSIADAMLAARKEGKP